MGEDTANTKRTFGIDEILRHIGEFGRYQIVLDCLIFVLLLPASCHTIVMYFATLTPEWKCVNNSSICLLNGTLPADDNRRCHIPRHEWYYVEKDGFSLVTEFNLHCDKEWILFLITSSFFCGWGVGAIIIGRMADKYGRKKFMFPSIAIMMTVGFVTPFMPNIYLVVACRFIIGFFYPGVAIQGFILISEYVGNKQRPLATGIIMLAFPTSWSFLALYAYLLKDWKNMSFVCTAPYVFVLGFYKFIPESIRWLQLNGRRDEVMKILQRAARFNKKELSSDISLSIPTVTDSRRSSVIDIFRGRKIALWSLIQIYLWMFIAMGFYGIQLAASDLEGSVYRDFVLLCLAEYPSTAFAVVICNKFGRRKGTLIPLFVGGASCLGIAFIPENGTLKIARITLGLTGKLVMNAAFHNLYIWSAEIFPTDVRAEAMGLLQVSSRIGSASSPWVAKGLKIYGAWIPFIVMGITSVIGSLLGVFLPETQNLAMKESVKQNEIATGNADGSHENNVDIEMKNI